MKASRKPDPESEILRDSEQQLKDVIQGSPIPQFVLDTNHRVLHWNTALEQLSGIRAEEVIGTDEHWRAFFPEKRVCLADLLIENDWAGIERLYETRPDAFPSPDTACSASAFYPDMGENGKWLRFRAAVIRNAAQRVVGVIETVEDITERKEAGRQREKMIAELKAKNEELERFTYTVSHDLKSPLFTLQGFLALLREDLAEEDVQAVENDIQRMERATEKMARLLDELLELSRIGRLVRPSEEMNLEELVCEALDRIARKIADGNVRIMVAKNLPRVRADRQRLIAVFQNLVDNAVKYMGDQAQPRVEIGVRHHGEEAVFFVRDNGIGIQPCHHDDIFALFERLDQKTEGTGVGLAMAKRIIEVHGGRIWVESEGRGSGATFCFTLAPGEI